MLDIKFIRENKDVVDRAQKIKKVRKVVDLDHLLSLSDERKSLSQQRDELNARKNQAAKDRNIEEGGKIKTELQALEEKFKAVDKEYVSLMLELPNIPSPDTPVGEDDNDNKVLRTWGEKPTFTFKPKEHFEIGTELGIIDNETAGETSGARFTFLKGDLALMQFALMQFAIETLTSEKTIGEIIAKAGLDIDPKTFVPVIPPTMIKPAVYNRMARLEPREDKYHIEADDLWMIGSAEHTMGAMYMDKTIDESMLPLRFIGYSTAYRREAGSYGKDTKGILRMHQFDKLEMETFSLPEYSVQEQDLLVAIQEHLMQSLGLPYQVVSVCSGDMGLPDYRQIDIETWMPGQDKYRETHSADLMTSYQSRRLNSRVKRVDGETDFVHMNDATAFAVGRTLIGIIENYQQEDGTIKVPEVLQKYMGGKQVITKVQA